MQWTATVFALRWLVLVLSIGGMGSLNLLIRSGGAVMFASMFYLTPCATALIAWLVFGEKLTFLTAILGMGLAVGCMVRAGRRNGAACTFGHRSGLEGDRLWCDENKAMSCSIRQRLSN